ncbi:recombinase family protein [Lachnospiraceae bacterium ZAX-1]
MGHTPFGYQIKKGKAVIDIESAKQIRTLYQSYLAGDSLTIASRKAGIKKCHASIGRILQNACYLGNAYYPKIIGLEIFTAVKLERKKRVVKLGRTCKPKEEMAVVYPMAFHMSGGTQHFDDPFEQAEYVYSLIEAEVSENGSQ